MKVFKNLINRFQSLTFKSSYPSDDIAGGTDGTTRINLESYQRAHYNGFGEVTRIYSKRKDSKQMIAWYMPKSGWNGDRSANEATGYQPVTWIGSHFEANDHGSNHVHWEIEVPDSTGALQGRLEIPFANATTGAIGLDKTFIKTNLADFVVRCSNGQVLRLTAAAGSAMDMQFNHDSEGATSARRWVVRANATAESGGDVGTDFQILRYNDSGNILGASPLFIERKTGNVGLSTTGPTKALDINGNGIRIRTSSTPASASAAGNAGEMSWDANYIYVCTATNTWKRSALTTW